MNAQLLFPCSLLAMLMLLFDSAYSQLPLRLPNHCFSRSIGLILPPRGNETAPLAKTKKDTLVVSRSDSYLLITDDWLHYSYNLFTYDAGGRITESTTYSINFISGNDSIISRTTYEYDPLGISVRSTMTGVDFDSMGGPNVDTVRIITSIYPDYTVYIGTLTQSLTTPALMPNILYDSSKVLMVMRDSVTAQWDTLLKGEAHYLMESNNPTRITETVFYKGKMDAPASYTYDYISKTSTDNSTDTIQMQMVAMNGEPNDYISELMYLSGFRIIYRYDTQHRLIEQTTESMDSTTMTWINQWNNLIHYSTSGYVDTTWMRTWDSLAGDWKDIMKNVLTYSSISLSSKDNPHLESMNLCLSFRWKNNTLYLAPTIGFRITGVIQYDLRGRLINRYDESDFIHHDNEYVVPLQKKNTSINVIAIYTDRGVHLLKGMR